MAENTTEWFEEPTPPDDDVMYVDVGGYEGPLDLLLDLARRQKVDLAQISVLALAEQYLGFIETVREKRIEIAADYLVMAAWLAYLKSRLMVPQAASDDEPTGEMMAALLQFRLKRLEAMRMAAQRLMDRPLLGLQGVSRAARPSRRRSRGTACGKPAFTICSRPMRHSGERHAQRLHPARAQCLVAAGGARHPATG